MIFFFDLFVYNKKEKIIDTVYKLEDANTNYFHIDVMDGEFVENENYVNPNQEQELINTLGQELSQLKIQLIMGGII